MWYNPITDRDIIIVSLLLKFVLVNSSINRLVLDRFTIFKLYKKCKKAYKVTGYLNL
jgi:hypothetical protein